jgi:hypothetical protein
MDAILSNQFPDGWQTMPKSVVTYELAQKYVINSKNCVAYPQEDFLFTFLYGDS